MVQGQRRLDWMLRSIVVVPGGCNVVPTICYGTGGGEERGWMATNAVRRRQGQGCSCALSPPGLLRDEEAGECCSVVGEWSFVMLEWSPFGSDKHVKHRCSRGRI